MAWPPAFRFSYPSIATKLVDMDKKLDVLTFWPLSETGDSHTPVSDQGVERARVSRSPPATRGATVSSWGLRRLAIGPASLSVALRACLSFLSASSSLTAVACYPVSPPSSGSTTVDPDDAGPTHSRTCAMVPSSHVIERCPLLVVDGVILGRDLLDAKP